MGTIDTTENIAERDEREECSSRIEATDEPQQGGINFHVSMRDYTMKDMEELIIEAAARQLLGRFSDKLLAKVIEEKVMAAMVARADAQLERIANDVMGHVLTPAAYSQKQPVTIGETLAHLGREYLEQKVTTDGKPGSEAWHGSQLIKRIDYIARQAFEHKLTKELADATREASRTAVAEVKALYANVVTAETDKLRSAINAALAGK